MKASQLQFLQTNLRNTIRTIQEAIQTLKQFKRTADEGGLSELEYECHNELKRARADLKKYVSLQMATKASLRDVYASQRKATRQAQIDGMIEKIKGASGEVVE